MGKNSKGSGKRKLKAMLQDTKGMSASASPSAIHCPAESRKEDAKLWFDSCPTLDSNITMVAMPDTPEKPLSKKTKREETGMNTTTGHSESNMDILAAIHKLSLKHDATFQKIFTIEKITQATSR